MTPTEYRTALVRLVVLYRKESLTTEEFLEQMNLDKAVEEYELKRRTED